MNTIQYKQAEALLDAKEVAELQKKTIAENRSVSRAIELMERQQALRDYEEREKSMLAMKEMICARWQEVT